MIQPAGATPEFGPGGIARCGTHTPSEAVIRGVEARLQAHTRVPRSSAVAPLSVPVVFHVIQDSFDSNSTTNAQLEAQIARLNTSYAGLAEFVLTATNVVVNDEWFSVRAGSNADIAMHAQLKTGGAETLNVYVNQSFVNRPGDLLGYASFPWDCDDNPSIDGVSILYSTVPGGSARNYNQGKTLVHEVGHWLGLYHTFHPPNSLRPLSSTNNGCRGNGDRVSDTPAERVPHYICRVTDSCPAKGKDPVSNFMNYTNDSCLTKFSKGQKARTLAMWSLYRAN